MDETEGVYMVRKRVGVCGILLLAAFLGWRLYVARRTVELGDMRWENLGHNVSRICYGHKTLIGPGGIELEERKDHIFGMCIGATEECEWFVIDKKTHQVFTGERYDDLLRKIKGRYPIIVPRSYETFETRKMKQRRQL
jgi:hypothetical protein